MTKLRFKFTQSKFGKSAYHPLRNCLKPKARVSDCSGNRADSYQDGLVRYRLKRKARPGLAQRFAS